LGLTLFFATSAPATAFHSHLGHSGGGGHYNNGSYRTSWVRGQAGTDVTSPSYDPGHPVQTGASFSGPAHIDPSQYHYFVQEYNWSKPTAQMTQHYNWSGGTVRTNQELRNAVGTTYSVQNAPRAAGLQYK
jgi:hypothetical protein